MISGVLQAGTQFDRRDALVTGPSVGPQTTSWRELAELSAVCHRALEPISGLRVGYRMIPTATGLASLAAMDELNVAAFLFDAELSQHDCLQLSTNLNLAFFVEPATPTDSAGPVTIHPIAGMTATETASSVTILTSGTSGKPKAARHTWQGLTRPVRRCESTDSQRWLLTYRPHLYAGLQVILQALINYGTLVVPPEQAEPTEVARLMAAANVQYASATPSFWRRLLLFSDPNELRHLPLKQITLGGEAIDQHILDSLAAHLPKARVTQIYATTELGRCFSVTDGRAGFPVRFLEPDVLDGVELRVVDDELQVRSANAMLSYDATTSSPTQATSDGWFPTGDLVRRTAQRVLFVGRKTDMINVGGNKVHPLEVERVVRQVDGVADVRVYGHNSSITGQLVACEIVPVKTHNQETLRRRIMDACATHLSRYQNPRLINFVSAIQLTSSGKTGRTEAADE